ncbi:hypothetical protein H9Q10_11625 [Eikenella sp. S3360]|uniref:Uncharacterized protein n=1 Tax=Eikenella glucosivorans TaxID=2766967 RepID=A0ABS0NDH6_9NEIS|nr:DUF6348 family protein [Eikenella glucosivorans]MBH5330312.1 hypothetical protein [Eikenella glucosivorans]
MPTQEPDTLNLNEALAEILQAHGYACQTQGDKILPDFAVPVRLETWAFPREHANGVVVSRFDVGITLPDGRELYECCGDIGENLEEALSRNLQSFCTNSLHVLLDAFNPGENRCPHEIWTARNGKRFQAILGDWTTKKPAEDTDGGNAEAIGSIIPAALESTLQSVICNQKLEAQYHLIRFFYAQSKNKTLNVEFMADNQDDAEAEKQLARLPWPRREDYYSVRRCIVLKPLYEGRS